MYIGEHEVLSTIEDPTDKDSVVVELDKKDKKVSLKKKLFDLIVKEEKGNGNIADARDTYVAQKFLLELADYGYERYEIEGIANSIGTLVHNITEAKIGEKFGCANSDRIKLSDLIV